MAHSISLLKGRRLRPLIIGRRYILRANGFGHGGDDSDNRDTSDGDHNSTSDDNDGSQSKNDTNDNNGGGNGSSSFPNGPNSGNSPDGSKNSPGGSPPGSPGGSSSGGGSSTPSNGPEGAGNSNSPGGNGTSSTSGGDNMPPPSGGANFGHFGPPGCDFVDESDGRLHYSAGWVLNSFFSGTTHSTTINGSSVSVSFNGTSIIVVGTVPPSNASVGPPFATYTIDGQNSIELSLPIATRSFPNQQFFQSMQVDPGAHTLTIDVTTTGNSYILDYLFFCGQMTKQSNQNDAPVKVAPAACSTRTVEIVSGVLGTVVFLLLLVIACLLLRRRRLRDRSKRSAISPIREWIQRQTIFTSSESIMRNNPRATDSSGIRSGTQSDGKTTRERPTTLPTVIFERPPPQQPVPF